MKISATRCILNHLPHYAEEGNLCTSVAVQDVINSISKDAKVSEDVATALVAMVQRLFASLALLERQQLQQGRWQFVSFPAQLLAHSLLCVLADESQDLLGTHYWEQGGHRPEDVIEEQRHLLRTLESHRVRGHQRQSAAPIRFVYVAWGIIKLDGRFLLHHREDKARRKIGNYVFPGGRFNLTDLPPASQTASLLPRLQCAASPEALANLRNTFIREMQEETGLIHDEHYNFHLWRSLKPYREVEGSRNNHAYTEYMILFSSFGLLEFASNLALSWSSIILGGSPNG
jgi:8-oxo-dGTP pyrophosphatase MutT (NUDIX family)